MMSRFNEEADEEKCIEKNEACGGKVRAQRTKWQCNIWEHFKWIENTGNLFTENETRRCCLFSFKTSFDNTLLIIFPVLKDCYCIPNPSNRKYYETLPILIFVCVYTYVLSFLALTLTGSQQSSLPILTWGLLINLNAHIDVPSFCCRVDMR